MPPWLVLTLQTVAVVPGVDGFDLAAPVRPRAPTIVPRCDTAGSPDEVVVCGRRPDRYRLPPSDAPSSSPQGPAAGATGMTALTGNAPCGIFAGQRRCDKREAAKYGYGGGRDPITILTRLAKKAVDPDSD